MNFKKFTALSLGITIMGGLSGCGDDTATNTTPKEDIYTEVGTYPIVKEGYTDSFTAFAPLRPNVTTYDVSTNLFTQHLEELTGMHIEFIECTEAERIQKMNIMMTGGDYTDVILNGMISSSELLLYGQQGIFIPLNELIDKYAPNIKKALEENPVVKATWTQEDGNIYCIPRIGTSLNNQVGNKMWLNKNWLDNLGLEVPETLDDFYQVLKAFKEQDANGNGDPNDEVPLTGSVKAWNGDIIPFILNAFIPASPSSKYFNRDENGQIYYVKATNEWKEFLKFMNKLNSEGLLDPLYFSQTADQLKQLGSNPNAVLVGATPGGQPTVLCNTADYERWNQYIALPPLEGPEGVVSAAHTPDYGASVLSITNKCDNPEAVIRVFDYMYTKEGSLANEYGLEGTGRYVYAPEGTVNYFGDPAEIINISADEAVDVSWNTMGPKYNPPDWIEMFGAKENLNEDMGRLLYLSGINDYWPVVQDPATLVPPLAFTTDESRAIIDIETNLYMYVDQMTMEMITGTKDIDKEWDNYLATLEKHGLSRLIEINQTTLDRKNN